MTRVPGRKLVRRAWRPVARALFPGAVVLGYHRVAAAPWDPLGLAVSPDRFIAQVEALESLREIVRLGELAARHAAGEPLARYAALTFDDGYADFAETVLPILAERTLPATVFVSTGFTGGSFWWSEIAALLAPGVGTAASLEIARDAESPWRYAGLDRPERRAAAVRDLCYRLVAADAAEIRSVIEQLRAWAGASGVAVADSVLPSQGVPLTRAQLAGLGRATADVGATSVATRGFATKVAPTSAPTASPTVEIGAHTVSHGCLGRVTTEAQRAEIGRSKADLESATGAPVTVFSYPNGSYNKETPQLVRALGFTCACMSRDGAFHARTDPYLIPRIWAPNADEPAFRRWLGQWAH